MARISTILLTAVFVLGITNGCSTRYQITGAGVTQGARVGVLTSSESTIHRSHIYEILLRKGLAPIAVNDVSVWRFFSKTLLEHTNVTEIKKEESADFEPVKVLATPVMLGKMQATFKELGLEYVLLVHTWGKALDHEIHAMMVHVDTMQVTGVSFNKRRAMVAHWAGWSIFFGLSIFICPFFYLADVDKTSHEILEAFIEEQIRHGSSMPSLAPIQPESQQAPQSPEATPSDQQPAPTAAPTAPAEPSADPTE